MRMNKIQIERLSSVFEEMVYQNELDCAVRKARKILALVGCTVRKKGCYVTLCSPRTGEHTLNMTLGVRPVSDLMAHVAGFAEMQTHVPHGAQIASLMAGLK